MSNSNSTTTLNLKPTLSYQLNSILPSILEIWSKFDLRREVKANLNQQMLSCQLSYLVYWTGLCFVLGIELKQKESMCESEADQGFLRRIYANPRGLYFPKQVMFSVFLKWKLEKENAQARQNACWLTIRTRFTALVFRMLVFTIIHWNLGAPRVNVSKPTPIYRKEEFLNTLCTA